MTSGNEPRHTVNWRQAFAEVVLIVVGVGLALAVDNWADSRQELDEEQQYLVRLLDDFEATRDSLGQTLEDIRANRDLKLRLMELLRGPSNAVAEDELSRMIRESFYIQLPTVAFATYADMVNSGDLRLIRDTDLRLRLADFDSTWHDFQAIVAEGFDQWNQLQVPYLIENASVASVYSAGYDGVQLPGSGEPIDRSMIWSQEFANILAISVISRQDMIRENEHMLDMADKVLALISESIE